MVLLTITSEPRNPPLPSLKFNHLEKKNAQSFKKTRHAEVLKSGRSQRDVHSPVNYTWRIHSPDASPTLMQLTDPGQVETNCGDRACWGRERDRHQLLIHGSATALPASPWASHLRLPPLFLFFSLPAPLFSLIVHIYHPVLQQTRSPIPPSGIQSSSSSAGASMRHPRCPWKIGPRDLFSRIVLLVQGSQFGLRFYKLL